MHPVIKEALRALRPSSWSEAMASSSAKPQTASGAALAKIGAKSEAGDAEMKAEEEELPDADEDEEEDEEEEKKEEEEEEEEESNLLLVVVAVVILFFDVVTSPVSSTVADVRIDIVRNEDSDARVRTEEVTEDDDEEAKFRRSFSTSSPRGIRRRILCEDDKSFDAPLKLTDAAFLRIFFDAPVFCTRQALVCADLDDVGQDEDMICFFDLWCALVGITQNIG